MFSLHPFLYVNQEPFPSLLFSQSPLYFGHNGDLGTVGSADSYFTFS